MKRRDDKKEFSGTTCFNSRRRAAGPAVKFINNASPTESARPYIFD
jgi:hypothetical protein